MWGAWRYSIAMTLSCPLLSYGWIRAALLGCNMIPRPWSYSLQDAEVNNKFITQPFECLSQHTLPHPDLCLPLVSFPLFFRSRATQSSLISDETMLPHPLPSLPLCTLLSTHHSFDRLVLWPVRQIPKSLLRQGERGRSINVLSCSSSHLLSFPKQTAPWVVHIFNMPSIFFFFFFFCHPAQVFL